MTVALEDINFKKLLKPGIKLKKKKKNNKLNDDE